MALVREEQEKLDQKDEQLLLSLIKDCRTPLSRLSKDVGLSISTTTERISKLEQSGIIKHYKLSLNHKAFPYEEFDIYYTLTNVSQFTINHAMRYLQECKYTTQVISTMGWCDLRITVLARSMRHLEEILEGVEKNFAANIKTRTILAVARKFKSKAESFLSALFGKQITVQRKMQQVYTNKPAKLDATDKRIIKELANNPKASYREIAKQVKLTPEAISARVRNLERRQVIMGYTTLLDGPKLGYRWAVLLVNIRYPSDNEHANVLEYIQIHANVSSAVETIGLFNLSITIFGQTIDSLRQTELAFRSQFGEHITDTALLFLLENEKYPDLAEGILD